MVAGGPGPAMLFLFFSVHSHLALGNQQAPSGNLEAGRQGQAPSHADPLSGHPSGEALEQQVVVPEQQQQH